MHLRRAAVHDQAWPDHLFYFAASFSAASFWAVASASAAETFTSGSTPVPSQLVLETGLTAFAKGTPIMKWSSMRWPDTGWAPPPVVSPTIVARPRFLRL